MSDSKTVQEFLFLTSLKHSSSKIETTLMVRVHMYRNIREWMNSSLWLVSDMSITCSSLSLLIDFRLKSILLGNSLATPASFLVHLIGKPIPIPVLWGIVCFCVPSVFLVSRRMLDPYFFIHSLILCLFIGELSPLILTNIAI